MFGERKLFKNEVICAKMMQKKIQEMKTKKDGGKSCEIFLFSSFFIFGAKKEGKIEKRKKGR